MPLLVLAYGAFLIWAVFQSLVSGWWLPASALLNLVTFFMYWTDKQAAQTGRWRTPENTLQGLALAGGWPAAWCAQRLLRHKTQKASFRITFALMVMLHCAALAAVLFWPQGQTLLASISGSR